MIFGLEFCKEIRNNFNWNISEIIALLSRIQNDGIERMTFGQNIYWLLLDGGASKYIKEATILALAINNRRAAAWGLILTVFWAREDKSAKLQELLNRQPLLKTLWSYRFIRDQLNKYGEIILDSSPWSCL